MKKVDTYKEVRTLEFPGMIARVYIPDLTPEERSRRLKSLHKQVAEFMKKVETTCTAENQPLHSAT